MAPKSPYFYPNLRCGFVCAFHVRYATACKQGGYGDFSANPYVCIWTVDTLVCLLVCLFVVVVVVVVVVVLVQQPPGGQGLLIHEVYRSHLGTPHSAGLLLTSDQPDAVTST